MSIYISSGGTEPVQGFHVPSINEWQSVHNILDTLMTTYVNADTYYTYLKLKLSGGYRSNTTGNITLDNYFFYRTNTPTESGNAYALTATGDGDMQFWQNYARSRGMLVRLFKNSPSIPDSGRQTLYSGSGGAGVFYNSTLGLISLSSDGTSRITIADKNLGAENVLDKGCYYQWGNNYGFAASGSVTVSSTLVDTSQYGPGNLYYSDIFITSSGDWSITRNDGLRAYNPFVGKISNVYLGTMQAPEVYVGDVKVRPTTVPVDICFSYTGAAQCWTVPATQEYCIEVWGAQGGNSPSNSYVGGYGGYAAGKICLKEGCTLCIYVGGHPATCTTRGGYTCGWNGGGCGRVGCYSKAWVYAQGGGGGTDVRYNGNTLCHRFIVAGGGAGGACGCCQSINMATIGAGGGECGCSPAGANWVGKQNAAGCRGSFGQGADGGTDCDYKNHAGGGGGGWYGGGATNCKCDTNKTYQCCAGGGSGYTYTASTCGNHPNKSCLGDLPLMTDAVCCPGSGTIPTPSGGTQTGWQGNGCVKITNV